MNIKVAHKLLSGFGIVIALSVAVGWYSLSKLAFVNDLTAIISDRDLTAQRALGNATASQDQMAILRERSLSMALLRKNGYLDGSADSIKERWRTQTEKTKALLEQIRGNAIEYERQVISNERQLRWAKLIKAIEGAVDKLGSVRDEVERQFMVQEQGDFAGILRGVETLGALRAAYDEDIDEAKTLVAELSQLGKRASAAAYEDARFSIFIVLAAVVILGAVGGWLIQRSITRPLTSFMNLVQRVGEGDLTGEAAVSGSDEFSSLGRSLNAMVAGLRSVNQRVSEVTESLGSAASEIVAATQQQNASANEQATAVQQTTATMEEIGLSGREITERVQMVSKAADTSLEASGTGVDAVQESTRSMEGIGDQAKVVAETIVALSEKMQTIGSTIGLVNDVAEQSNLLALNAAIEATEAGEQGRRFSVVANEMKTLADQSKGATQQVRTILEEVQQGINTLVMLTEEAVKRVEVGREQSQVAEHTIRQLAGSTEESVTAFQQILAATGQQQVGLEQVAEALKNIRQATEQTASGTEQLETSAINLNQLSNDLQSAVEQYRM